MDFCKKSYVESTKFFSSCKFEIMFLQIVTLSATNVTMFEYTDMMKKLFEKQAEVEQVSDFWEVRDIYLMFLLMS